MPHLHQCSRGLALHLLFYFFCLLHAAEPISVALPAVYVKANASKAATRGLKEGGPCQVLYLDSQETVFLPSGQSLNLQAFDAILTNAHDIVPWTTNTGMVHYMDASKYPHQPGRDLYESKKFLRSVSILVPRQPQSEDVHRWAQEAFAVMPQDTYIDDGTPESRRPAFEGYAFSVLLSLDAQIPPQQILEAVAYSAVPMLVFTIKHFINYTVYFPYMVGKFRAENFSPEYAKRFIETVHKDAIYVMQNSLMLVQDFFYFRYSLPFGDRVKLLASRICEDAAVPAPLRTDIFVAIYSAKVNLARRRALRETWLTFLSQAISNPGPDGAAGESIYVAYRFFVNALGAGDPSDPASSVIDDPLRSESEVFSDLVFLEALEEYPIGNMGRLALRWIANHTAAPYILKIDDDMYVRPLPIFRHLMRQQRAMLYWGFFERSGLVVRDPESAHFLTDDLFGHDGVFPPYARGAALAMSLDLVRLITHYDRMGKLRRLKVEDASYGYFLWQILMSGITSVTLADREEASFALDPKCCTEKTHPNNCWSPLGPLTWVVHHVGPKAVRCMWRTDLEAGYYRPVQPPPPDGRQCLSAFALTMLAPGDDSTVGIDAAPHPCQLQVAAAPQPEPQVYEPKRSEALPSLCGCVHTPPPHPDRPIPGPMREGPSGPTLYGNE